ncbi:Serine/threonine-protein kinase/endoribonuclease IRE1 [Gurleya vavrai]
MKLKADVFSLGILLHMNYAKNHPYDLGGSIEKNILKGVFRLSFIADGTLLDLITNCIKYNYKERLSIDDVVNHVYFWSNEKKFNFLANLSDFLEFKSEESKKVNNRLERNKKKVFINKWNNYIDQEVIEEMQEHRYYNFTYMKELLRVIRNKGRHFKEMPENIKKYYVSFPDGYVNYYLERFPHLLSTCHYSAKIACNEEMLRNFYYNHIN